MNDEQTRKPSRWRLFAALMALVPHFSLFRHIRPTDHDDIGEAEGWSLKRSDLL